MQFKKINISTNLSSTHKIYKSLYFKILNLKLKQHLKTCELNTKYANIINRFFGKLLSLSKRLTQQTQSILSNKFKQNMRNIKNFDSHNSYIKIYSHVSPIRERQTRAILYRYANLWH